MARGKREQKPNPEADEYEMEFGDSEREERGAANTRTKLTGKEKERERETKAHRVHAIDPPILLTCKRLHTEYWSSGSTLCAAQSKCSISSSRSTTGLHHICFAAAVAAGAPALLSCYCTPISYLLPVTSSVLMVQQQIRCNDICQPRADRREIRARGA